MSMVPESVLKGLSWGGQHMKRPYETPRLVEYGPIADRTLQTPGQSALTRNETGTSKARPSHR
ncbi:MAG: lasso RiPP family leader peptide-containing protein [Chloroflexi bacterium]|nr:MAG: lasso RiPP family leader peptide-containing protein [Chloroflexota bacterium]